MGDWGDIFYEENDTTIKHSGTASARISYSGRASQDQRWAGMYWQAPAGSWGDRTGGYNLTGASRMTLWARGAGGGEKVNFLMGGITGRYNDTVQPPRETGVVTLTNNWQKYTIDLKDADLTRVSGGFAWTAEQSDNPKGATFYVDDIRYENVASPPGDAFTQPLWGLFPTDCYGMLAAHTYDQGESVLI